MVQLVEKIIIEVVMVATICSLDLLILIGSDTLAYHILTLSISEFIAKAKDDLCPVKEPDPTKYLKLTF